MMQAILEWKEDKISGGEAGMRNKTNIQDIHRLAVCSDLRRNILINLYEGEKSLGDLRDELKISSTTAIHALRELEKVGLTFQDANRKYALTNTGRITTLKLVDFSDAAEVLKKHERFWLEHDLSGIPEHMMERIGWLRDSTLTENTSTDIFKVHTNFINLLQGAKEIKGVSPIFHPEFMHLFEDLIINKKVDVELILTKEVMEKLDKAVIKKIYTCEDAKFKLYVTEEAKAAFTVTDFFLSFGLFYADGTYDYNRDLVIYNKEGIEWGRDLYGWYLQQAERA
jgi:predicted transcriptional regulator